MRIHLDTDIGGDIDDLCALAFLLRRKGVEVSAITTVADIGGKRAGYARHVLRLEERDEIPVAAGADVTLGCYRSLDEFPGELGCYRIRPDFPEEVRYWGHPISPLPNSIERALDLLRKSIEEDTTIVCTGPYTNLYLLDKKYPGILSRARPVLMGGYAFKSREGFPNWGNNMDYNIQVDIQSAQHVLKHTSPTLVPLSVTVETSLRRRDLAALQDAGDLGRLIVRQAEAYAQDQQYEEKYGRTCRNLPRDTINFQHDPLTCAIAIGWREGVHFDVIPLKLETQDGWLIEKEDSSGWPIRMVTRIDGARFGKFWLATLLSMK